MRKSERVVVVAVVAAFVLSGRLIAQDEAARENPNLSRQMQLAIRYFEHGDDMQAMDRFIDLLTVGDPAERNMANEYINLINHRMNTGETMTPEEPSSRRPATTSAESASAPQAPPVRAAAPPAPRAPEVVVESAARTEAAPAFVPKAPPTPQRVAAPPPSRVEAPEAPLPTVDKALMKKEIKSKIRSGVEAGLKELRAIEGVKVLMMETGDPQAIGIPSSLLFSQGISFQKDAQPVIEAITKIMFSLGSAQIVILPEGTSVGDAKILDMRRTMGISSQLSSAGVAPSRVKVNLLNSQVDIPRPLMEFRGIMILFVYNQPLNLVVDSSLGEEGGPPISLGIYPTSFHPDRNEGAIVEFSVQDPPAGLVSWKFQLLQPTSGDGRDLAPLQDVVGGSPVFHQIYWNGRQNYFGAPLPAGRYEAVLTATDAKNRQRTLHRWIQVIDASGGLGAPAAAKAAPAPAPAAPPADLSAPAKAETLVTEKAKVAVVEIGKKKKSAKKKRAKKAASAAAPVADAEPAAAGGDAKPAAAPAKPDSGNTVLDFAENTYQLSQDAERKLARVHDTLVYYPMENLKIVGYAGSSESDAAGLAEKRAQMVASLLINKYQVEPKKIQVTSETSSAGSHKVEVVFIKSE